MVNLFIAYDLDTWSRDLYTDFTLKNCLLGSAKLTKNPDPDKYIYSSYSIGFDSQSEFSFTDRSMGKMPLFFELIWVHLCILITEGPTQGLDDAVLTAKAKYHFNFTRSNRRLVLYLHYNGSNSFVFVNATKYINSEKMILKQK